MPIKVDCPSCGHRYQVGDNMAGKKVKCKTCGSVIAIPSGSGDDFDFSPVDVAAPAAPSPGRSRAGAAPPSRPVQAARDPQYDIDENELSPDEVAAQAAEVDRAYGFKGAGALEKAIPIVLVVAGLGWMTVQAFRADDPHGWVGPFRAAVYLLVYCAVMFPIVLAGVRTAGVKVYFPMPADYKWRTFGLFCLPAALGAIFTLSGGGFPMLVLGMAIGLLVSLALFIFMFNLRPHQVGKAMGFVAAYSVAGAVVAVGVMIGISYLTLAALTFGKTASEYAMSPVGPQFNWQPPAAPEEPKKKKASGPLVLGSGPTTAEANPDSTIPTAPPTTAPAAGTTTQPAVATTAPTTLPAVAAATKPAPTETPAPAVAQDHQPAPAPEAPATSPLLAAAPTALPFGAIEDAYFPGQGVGTGSSPAAVLTLVTHTNFGDAFDLWTPGVSGWEKAKSVTAQPKMSEQCGGGVVLLRQTTGGLAMVRVVDFPRTMAEVRLLSGDGAGDASKVRTVDLDTSHGPVSLVGMNNTGMLITATGGAQPELDVFDPAFASVTAAVQRRRNVQMPGLPGEGHSNIAVTPDGHTAASIRWAPMPRGNLPAGNYVVIDGVLNGNFENLAVTGLQPSRAVGLNGLAFSPDGQRLALLYQDNGAGLIETYRVPSGKQIASHIFAGPAAMPINEFRGSAIDWLADGSALLINGRYVMDAESFNDMGDLGIENVRAQHVIDRGSLLVLTRAGGKAQVLAVKLDTSKFHAAAASSKPVGGHGAVNADVRDAANATH